jgi:hypothetical protein
MRWDTAYSKERSWPDRAVVVILIGTGETLEQRGALMRGPEGAGIPTRRNWGRPLAGGLIFALAGGVLAVAWWKGLDRFLVANIPQDQSIDGKLHPGASPWSDTGEFVSFLGLATITGLVLGILYGKLTGRGEQRATGPVRAPLVGRVAGVASVCIVLVLAIVAEFMIMTRLCGNTIGSLRGETSRKEMRRPPASPQLRLALQKLVEEGRSQSGPNYFLIPAMRLHVRAAEVAAFGKDAVPDLQAMLNDASPDTRKVAVITLGGMAPKVPAATLALTDALRYSVYADVRRRVADAMSNSPPPVNQAVPALVRALKDEDARVRRNAAASLGVILHSIPPVPGAETRESDPTETAAAVTALADALRDDDAGVRTNAGEALGMIGPAAKSAAPALMDALENGKVKREWVDSVLKRIDPEAAK